MKFIYPNKCGTISMTTENANFPAEYALTNYVKQKAKSTTYTTTFTVAVVRSGGLAIFGTNAILATVSYGSGIDIVWDAESWDTGIAWEQTAEYVALGSYNPQEYDYRGDGNGKLWVEYENPNPHDLTIELTCSELTEVEVGLIYAGPVYEYNNPLRNMAQGIRDYSIIREYNTPGAMYIENKDQVGIWEIEFIEDYVTNFYEFIYIIIGRAQLNPFPCWFIDDDYHHFAFCRVDDTALPQMQMGEMINHGRIQARFIEVV